MTDDSLAVVAGPSVRIVLYNKVSVVDDGAAAAVVFLSLPAGVGATTPTAAASVTMSTPWKVLHYIQSFS